MKKFLICAIISMAVITVGCGRRNTVKNAETHNTEAHDHSGCGDTHAHANETAHQHDGEEECGHDHSAENGHLEGQDHEHDGHSGCDGDHSADDAHAGHDHGSEEADPDEIVFPAAQSARTEFEVQTVRRGSFAEIIKCGGQVTAAQGQMSVVPAPVSGVVTFVDGRIMASSPVNRSQKLFYISSGSLASGDAALKARVAYEQAKAEFERAERLYADKIISSSEYLSAQAAFLTAQTEYEPLKELNEDGSVTISSPAAGYLAQVSVAAGDYVEMGQPLATVARSGRMQLKAHVSQKYFDRLGDVRDANFSFAGKTYTVSAMNGSLYSAGRIVSQGSSLIPVVFEFDGGNSVPDGAYVDVSLVGRRREDVMTLPLSAITEQQGLHYVYVQLDPECYSRREVRLGADDGSRVEILSGIRPGDRVVTKGAINVKMAGASGAIPHGHAH